MSSIYDSRGAAVEHTLAVSKRCAETHGFRRTICGAGPVLLVYTPGIDMAVRCSRRRPAFGHELNATQQAWLQALSGLELLGAKSGMAMATWSSEALRHLASVDTSS
jgi:hypothetical protein